MQQTATYQRPEGVRQAELRAEINARRSADRREVMRIKNGSLDYQGAVNLLLIEFDGPANGPTLSLDEMAALEFAFDHGVPVFEFVTQIRMAREVVR